MAAGAIATNGALPIAYLSFMLPALVPLNLMLAWRGDQQHLLIGGLTTFFILVLIVTFSRHYRVVRNSIALRFEKEQVLGELRNTNQRLHDMTAELAEGLFVLDEDGQVAFMNPEAERLLGWRREELADRKLHDLIHLHDSEELLPGDQCGVMQALKDRTVCRRDGERFKRNNGSSFPVAYSASPMLLPDGRPAVVVSFQDITARKSLEKQLAELATHDDLTGLYNRRELERLLEVETQRSRRYQRPLSVFMLDVDHFKQVNDDHGHDVGDQILRQLSERIRQNIRTADIATRYGGEEFVVILPETPLEEALEAAERLRTAVAGAPFPLTDGQALDIRISIGVACLAGEETGSPDIIKAADDAMYQAKQAGRNRVRAA
jgi:diguanylate cyclase (GGDEF)-like protein/PAS domain S-box-containing protein